MAEQGHGERVDDDYISELPDDILSLILSLLSMQDAVRTRLLSRRWRFLCSCSSNLCFDLSSVLGIKYSRYDRGIYQLCSEHKSKFILGVDQFLRFCSVPKLEAFKVKFYLGNEAKLHIDRWVDLALGMETDTISLSLYFLPDVDRYNFPCHLLPPHGRASHLKHLRLKSCTLTPSPDYAKRLGSLVTLRLSFVPLSQFHLDTILSGCSNLEWLKVVRCFLPKYLCVSGPSLPLKSLIIDDRNDKGFVILELNSLHELHTFEYSGRVRQFTFVDVPALKIMFFQFSNEGGVGTRYVFNELAKDVHDLELLSLKFIPFEVPLIPESTTAFRHLKQLELDICISREYDLLNIVHILNASPALQKLHLSLRYSVDWNVVPGGRLENEQPHLQLKEVEIFKFDGRSSEIDFVSYLLNNCIALELLVFSSVRKPNFGPSKGLQQKAYCSRLNSEAIHNLFSGKKFNSKVEIIVC